MLELFAQALPLPWLRSPGQNRCPKARTSYLMDHKNLTFSQLQLYPHQNSLKLFSSKWSTRTMLDIKHNRSIYIISII